MPWSPFQWVSKFLLKIWTVHQDTKVNNAQLVHCVEAMKLILALPFQGILGSYSGGAGFFYECCEWWQLLFLNCADSRVFSQDHCCQSWAPCHYFSAICAKHSCHSWPPGWKSIRSSSEPGIHSEVSAYFNVESSFSFRKLQSHFSFSTQDSSNPFVHKIISLPTQLFKDRSRSFHSPTALKSFRSWEWPTQAAANSFQENRTRHQLRHPWGKCLPKFM